VPKLDTRGRAKRHGDGLLHRRPPGPQRERIPFVKPEHALAYTLGYDPARPGDDEAIVYTVVCRCGWEILFPDEAADQGKEAIDAHLRENGVAPLV
jgi:hypothetical protein